MKIKQNSYLLIKSMEIYLKIFFKMINDVVKHLKYLNAQRQGRKFIKNKSKAIQIFGGVEQSTMDYYKQIAIEENRIKYIKKEKLESILYSILGSIIITIIVELIHYYNLI